MWRKLATNTGVQLVGRVTTVLIGLLTTAWLTRNLGLEGYGRYTLLVALFVLLDSLADFGSKLVGAKEVAKVEGNMRWSKWSELLVWRGVWAVVITGAGVVLVSTLSGFEEFRGVAALSMVMVGLTAIAGTLEVGWQVSLKMERKVAVEVLMSVLTLVGFYALGVRVGLGEVIGILVGARIISLTWGWFGARGEMKVVSLGLSKKKFWDWFKMVAPMGWYMLIFAGYDRVVDTMMIGHWWGKQEVG
ncbi:MAG: oligosaccharide flippase family protein, partial [Candidatus Shapirobacteria bacterium]